jgi:hypothetical protein
VNGSVRLERRQPPTVRVHAPHPVVHGTGD